MAFQGDSIFWVEVGKIVPNPFQPRREFDEEKLRELADSIRMYGVLQPLTVTRREVHNEDGSFRTEYELIAGERRLRASTLAGVEQVPVIIRSGEQTEQEKLELAIIENLQREDLNAVDRALAFKQLADVFELSHGQVAKKVGRSREYVSNSIRLLALPEVILNALKKGEVSEGHARTLLMLKDKPAEQDVVFREILLKKLSVREVERIVRKIAQDKVRKKHWADSDAHLIELERAFTDTLGTRVQILKTDYGGKLTIDYFSEDDLQALLKLVATQPGSFEPARTEPATSVVDDAVSETVIRELDRPTGALAALAASTPLIAAEESDEEASGSDSRPMLSYPPLAREESAPVEPVSESPAPLMPPTTADRESSEDANRLSNNEHRAPAPVAATTSATAFTAAPSRNAPAVDEVSVESMTPPTPAPAQTLSEAVPPVMPASAGESTPEPSVAVPQSAVLQQPAPAPVSQPTPSAPLPPTPEEQAEALQHEVESIIDTAGDSIVSDLSAEEAPQSPDKATDDDDLYSVRNFSV